MPNLPTPCHRNPWSKAVPKLPRHSERSIENTTAFSPLDSETRVHARVLWTTGFALVLVTCTMTLRSTEVLGSPVMKRSLRLTFRSTAVAVTAVATWLVLGKGELANAEVSPKPPAPAPAPANYRDPRVPLDVRVSD